MPAFFNKRRAKSRELAFFKIWSTWVFQVRSSDRCTPKSLKLCTLSTHCPLMNIGWSHGIRYWRKFLIISLHFWGCSSIPRVDENWEIISSTTRGITLGEHLGTTFNAVVSSTNFIKGDSDMFLGVNLRWRISTRIYSNPFWHTVGWSGTL